jgi:Fe2+ transport system protein FeoA
MTFTQFEVGREVVVTNMDRLPVVLRRRLNSMGFIEGVHCYIHNKSIFGGPITIAYNKQIISLRKQDAALIGVKMA